MLKQITLDGGLRVQTPPTYRKGPSPSIGAQKLRPQGSAASTVASTTSWHSVGEHIASSSQPPNSPPSSPMRQNAQAQADSASPTAAAVATGRIEIIDGAAYVFVPTVSHIRRIQDEALPNPTDDSNFALPSPKTKHTAAVKGSEMHHAAARSSDQSPLRGAATAATMNTTATSAADSTTATRMLSFQSVSKSLQLALQFFSVVPRFAPEQPLEAQKCLRAVVETRSAVDVMLDESIDDLSRLELFFQQTHKRRQQLEAENKKLRQDLEIATDLAYAADAQMVRMSDEQRRLATEKQELAAEFEKKIFAVIHAGASDARTLASEYRTAECARLEREADELRSQLQKRNMWLIERGALLENLNKATKLTDRLARDITVKERSIEELQANIHALQESAKAKDAHHLTERLALTRELEQHRKQRSVTRQTIIIRKLLEVLERTKVQASCFALWRDFALSKRMSALQESYCLAQQDQEASGEGKQIKLKEEKQVLHREIARLTRRVDDQMLVVQQLRVELHSSKLVEKRLSEEISTLRETLRNSRSKSGDDRQTSSAEEAAAQSQEALDEASAMALVSLQAPSDPPPTSLIDIHRIASKKNKRRPDDDPQVQALKAYHTLNTVLLGIKRRLNLESLKVTALPVAERATAPMPSIVFNWIEEGFSFLHHIMSIEDRLLKTKIKLTFLNIQLKPNIKRIEAQLLFCGSDPPIVNLLKRQLNGYVEIQQGVKALKGHIDATAKALVSSTDPQKQEQIAVLTTTFEADVARFLQRVEENRRRQFTFEVELTRVKAVKADLVQRLLRGEDVNAAEALAKAASNAGRKQRTGGAGSNSPTNQSFADARQEMLAENAVKHFHAGANALTAPNSADTAAPSSPPPPPIAMQRKVSIGELLPTLKRFERPPSVGSWDVNPSRPMSHDLQRASSKSTALSEHQGEGLGETSPLAPPLAAVAVDNHHESNDPDVELNVEMSEHGDVRIDSKVIRAPAASSSDKSRVILTSNIPSIGSMHPPPIRKEPVKVLDQWAERQRQGLLVTSILRPGPDGKIDIKEFRRIKQERNAVSESVRRSLTSEVDQLARARRRLINVTLSDTSHSMDGSLQAASTALDTTSNTHITMMSPCSPERSASGAVVKNPMTVQVLDLPMRESTVTRAPLLLEKHRVPLEDSSEVIAKLLPRLGQKR